MDMGDLQTQMHMMVKDDASILLSQPTLETLPDKHKVFEEYISLDGGERDTSPTATIQFQYGYRTATVSK
jgi:hypothetical protein